MAELKGLVSQFKVTAAVAKNILVKKSAGYAERVSSSITADGYDAIGKTENAVTTANITAGLDSVAVAHLTPGTIQQLTASGSILLGTYVAQDSNGKIKQLDASATPTGCYRLGIALEAASTNGDQIDVLITKDYIVY